MYQNFITTIATLISALTLAAYLGWIEPRQSVEPDPLPPAVQYHALNVVTAKPPLQMEMGNPQGKPSSALHIIGSE